MQIIYFKAQVATRKRKYDFYTTSADGKVSGGRDLQSSAVYPKGFVRAIYKTWVQDVEYHGRPLFTYVF